MSPEKRERSGEAGILIASYRTSLNHEKLGRDQADDQVYNCSEQISVLNGLIDTLSKSGQ